MADVLIKINGDVKNFQAALGKAKSETEDLSDGLSKVAKVSAVAFAVLTAEIGFAVAAYAESERATNSLTQALINQNMYSRELIATYQGYAEQLSEVSMFQDEQIISGQAVLQNLIGQIPITKELTEAVVNFAAATGKDLVTAYQLVGKSIGTNTNALMRDGIVLDENSTRQQKIAQILEQGAGRWREMAEAQTKGLGAMFLMTKAFGEIQEEIGKRFAPAIEKASRFFTSLFNSIKNNSGLVDFISQALLTGTILAGVVTALSTTVIAFLAFKAVLAALGIVAITTKVAILSMIGATGIGLVAIVLADMVLNWESRWKGIFEYTKLIVTKIGRVISSFGTLMADVMYGRIDRLAQRWKELKDTMAEPLPVLPPPPPPPDDPGTSGDTETERKKKAQEAELRSRRSHYDAILAQNEEFQALDNEQKAAFKEKYKQEQIKDVENARTTELLLAKEKQDRQIKEHNEYLKNHKKFGESVAMLQQFMDSEKMQHAQNISNKMVGMQQSENQTLKSIGKAAAIVNITIDTARAAMSVYKSAVEIFGVFGVPIGAALAAGVVAFGMEQMGKVTAAADGGMITGGVAGRDSVPAMLMPGELVVPTRNFDEVVGATASAREGEGGGGMAHVILELKGELMDFIEAKTVERNRLNISFQGA